MGKVMKVSRCCLAAIVGCFIGRTACGVEKPLLMNEDCFHYFVMQGPQGDGSSEVNTVGNAGGPEFDLTERGLERYIDEIARGHVTHFLMNLNGSMAMFPSKAFEPVWASMLNPNLNHPKWIELLKETYDRGVDPYAVWIRRCREKGVKPWISIRMNDLHVVVQPKCAFVSEFWRQHPQWRIDPTRHYSPEEWGKCAFEDGLDYTVPEVRNRMLAFLKEVLDRYDPDGLELDMIRGTRYLPVGRERETEHVLTAFMRQAHGIVRRAEARRGHRVKVAVRLLTRPEESVKRGLRADLWAEEGLIDAVIPCNFWDSMDFDIPIAKWKEWTKNRVLVFAGTDSGITDSKGRRLASYSDYLNWARAARKNGADGFYLFNLFMHPRATTWNSVLDGGLGNSVNGRIFVNPFIGTDANGHCNPGAARPFAMVQPGPDTGAGDWRYCAGYQYRDTSILGFSQNHLCGTGQVEMGDVLLLPFCGEEVLRKSCFSHANETATPGYYAVTLDAAKVRAELTSTERVACHRYTYLEEGQEHLLVDLQHGLVGESQWANRMTLEGHADFAADGRSMSGTRLVEQYWPKHRMFFHMAFSRPFVSKRLLKNELATEKGERWVLDFDLKKGETLEVKVALSYRSVAGAKRNLEVEAPGWDFDGVRRASAQTWEDILSRIEIDGASADERAVFYTSLYHLCYQPNLISDVGENPRYSTFSFWDTYRAAHPLYTLLVPERVNGFVDSILDHAKTTGFMPIWEIYGKEGYDMIGSHSIPVVLDAWRKGFDVDLKAFYPFVKRTQTENNREFIAHRNGKPFENCHWKLLDKLGYYPCDVVTWGSISRLMETTFDDWCAAEMAKELGLKDDEAFFRRRADMWKNVFKPGAGWICPRTSGEDWLAGYDPAWLIRPKGFPAGFSADTTEGSGFQWSFHVLHDFAGLVAAMGGKDAFASKLDYLFEHLPFWKDDMSLVNVWPYREASGLIGEYAHGNEPCHHVAYLYSLTGDRRKTAARVREICRTQYANRPDGVCGNDDCGQMSAWYVFAALGFYPVNPASAEYVLGEPLFGKVRMKLGNGRSLEIIGDAKSRTSVWYNGEKLTANVIGHDRLLCGGRLQFDVD